MRRILICANPDLNLIDGSSIWAQTITLALAETGAAQVDFLAKSTPERDELFLPLLQHRQINVIDGTAKDFWEGKGIRRLNHGQMADVAITLNHVKTYDVIVVRGYEIAQKLAKNPDVLAKCWIYLTDIPQSISQYTKQDKDNLIALAQGSRRILYQSQGFLDLWREVVPKDIKVNYSLYSPVIPDISPHLTSIDLRPLRAVYAGKFKADWKTLEMAEIWPVVHWALPSSELIMIGDKIHAEPNRSDYQKDMKLALQGTKGLTWLGARSRQQVQDELGSARVGLSWRDERMNDTLEYSTKILEYGGAGCAAILNRNPLHETLLGADYPLYANNEQEFVTQLNLALNNPTITQQAAKRLSDLAQEHTFSSRVIHLTEWLNEELIMKKTVLVAGHDLKFFDILQKKLTQTGRYSFIFDKWQGHNKHNEQESQRLLCKADIIFCEWCLGNVKWYSNNKKDDQRLVARFHAQEERQPYFEEARLCNLDHVVFVGQHKLNASLKRLPEGHPPSSVIPNLIDADKFLPNKKMGDAFYTLGIIGITPQSKRIDLALDTLEILLEKDDRYQLRIKGAHPFDYSWLIKRPEELIYYQNIMKRINSSDRLRYKVIFDPTGDDVNQWLTLVGFILSPSDFESFHLSVGEGMLTGCVPVVWTWEGSAEIWPENSIVSSADAAAQKIIETSSDEWQEQGALAREYIITHFGVNDIMSSWGNVFEGNTV